ncbi:hypothetical protein BX661DRAFT_177739 [Kickxella alabastrina]|uniref:uncharacterized protein n=1 Tax=Kickxella alabastrina TaxID=61397 RepID=UPI00221F605D|nr:uncharacterized protein BX661DRAFT_177739 [Kickxella alabastrina]KAI7833892.1 hypothetical protein BX661DRAFT_177739 [Kickxella alabastrina]
MNLCRTAFLPGLELDSPMLVDCEQLDYPVPANGRLRQLEGAVLFGRVHTQPAATEARGVSLAAMDSPISDAGTGRTQILDFAEADIRAGPASAAKCRRPSARPEIRRVGDLLWADASAAAGAIVAAATATPGPLVGADTTQGADTNHFEEALPNGSPAARLAGKAPTKFATISALDPVSLQLLRSAGRASKEGAAAAAANGASSAAAATLNPMLLAKLVRSSPDPRSLIYDASSQFGSMRSFAAPNSDNAAAAPSEKVRKNGACLVYYCLRGFNATPRHATPRQGSECCLLESGGWGRDTVAAL